MSTTLRLNNYIEKGKLCMGLGLQDCTEVVDCTGLNCTEVVDCTRLVD